MFTDAELQNILSHIDMYHSSRTPFRKERAVQFIVSKLQEKLPNLSHSRVLELVNDIHPEINLSGICGDENPEDNTVYPRPTYVPRCRLPTPIISPNELTRKRKEAGVPDVLTETFFQRADRLRAEIDDTSRRKKLKEIEECHEEMNLKYKEYFRRRDENRADDVPETASGLIDRLRSHRLGATPIVEEPTLAAQPVEWMNGAERECFREMSESDKKLVCDAYVHMKESENTHAYPLRLQVLLSDITLVKKAEIFTRMENMIPGIGEFSKYTSWVNALLSIPFNTFTRMPCSSENPTEVFSYLTDSRALFDAEVYGHDRVKEEFISILGSWVKLGGSHSNGNVIGVTGPIGVGKTTLIKDGLARALGRPFYFISLGGSSYSSFLNGHGYTYEGSIYGEIARGLIDSKCMDPVFYFDELDKVSTDSRGDEIIHTLIHLTDPAQNTSFNDRYFAGVPLDVSKALFVFSYNHKEKVNPILRDRIHEIVLEDFSRGEKVQIARQHVIPTICVGMGVHEHDLFVFDDDALSHLVELCDGSTGLRLLKTILIRLLRIINVASITDCQLILNLEEKFFQNKLPYRVSKEMITALFESHQIGQVIDHPPIGMYM